MASKKKPNGNGGRKVGPKNGKGNGAPVMAAAKAYSQRQAFPQLNGNKSRRIQNSELVGTLLGSVAFTANRFVINPGMAATFPWLSVQAAQWQQYKFNRLCFRYVTRTATDEKGSVILSPDYNPVDLPPNTEQQASNTQDAVEDVVWKELDCKLDPSAMFPLGPRKQVRTTNVAGDMSVYDAGRMFVCTIEEDSADPIGKIWVDYDVEFFVPQNSPSGSTGSLRTSEFGRITAQTLATGVATTLDFDAAFFDPLGIGNDAVGIFTPPAGTYLLVGFFTFNDNVAEVFAVNLDLEKNGAALSNPASSDATSAAVAALTEFVSLPIQAIITCNGTDTVRVRCTLTGAAGTLILVSNSSRLRWSMA